MIVLLCIICIGAVKLITIGIDNTKAEVITPYSDEAYLNLANTYNDANEQTKSEAVIYKKFNEGVEIVVGDVQLQKEESEQLKMDTEEMQKLDAESRDIDVFVTSSRAEIEAWYSKSLADLKAEGERRLTQLEGEKKAAYLRSLQQMNNTTEVSEKQVTEESFGRANVYVSPFGQAIIDSYGTTYGKEIETTHTSVEGNPTADYEATLYRLKKSEQANEQELWIAKRKLDAARQYKLIYLEEEAQRRRNVLEWKKRCVLKKMQQSVSDNDTPLTEVVPRIEAIGVSYNGESYVFIAGVFAHEGDTVNDLKILKIHQNKVEFEKNGLTVVGILRP
ncbi:MAG: hypothetical protein JXA96_02795 [Sedimentisphaerales bacterium]|nr:hypothetical protein [Sedimentisphaerales bacterium]